MSPVCTQVRMYHEAQASRQAVTMQSAVQLARAAAQARSPAGVGSGLSGGARLLTVLDIERLRSTVMQDVTNPPLVCALICRRSHTRGIYVCRRFRIWLPGS